MTMGQNAAAVLRFNNTDRNFYLHGANLVAHDHMADDGWTQVDAFTARTQSLKAAARFRASADELCEKVFKRVFSGMIQTPPPLPQHLRRLLDPHQIEGVKWVLSRKRSYLAHAPGAGKTAQAIIASLALPGPGQTVFIVPPGLTVNWEREIWKFTEAFPTIGIVGQTADQDNVAWRSDFLIIPDSMLTKPWVYSRLLKMKIKLLAVDEASRFKEPTSARSLALYGGANKRAQFKGLFQNASTTVFLDGSPMPNRPMELWAPVFALDPEAIECLSMHEFGIRYCGARLNDRYGVWEYKHSSNEAELRERLQKRFMHVVTESELSHPERRRSILFMSTDVRTAEMKAWEQKNLKLFDGELSEAMSQGEIAHQRAELGRRKIPWVANYIINRLENKPNERILLFAWHRDVCTGLAKALGDRVGLVMGGTPPDQRERIFSDFQNGSSLRVIVGNIQAMGRGHNLQRADRVVFAEPSWSDELNRQCEKRASRRGRDAAAFVRCEYIVAPGSVIDERVMKALFSKQKRVMEIIG